MSGQQTQQFRTTPGFQAPEASAAATTRTQGFQATAAVVESDARGLSAIGAALGGFFGNAAKSVESVGDTMHREELVQVDRENKALAQQGPVDQKLGKPMDPRYVDRQDYYGAYQTAAADQSATQLSGLLKDKLASMPLDGSADPQAISEQFYKDHIGKGTGDRDYDDRLLSQFGRQAAGQVTAAQESIFRTTKQNTTETIITNASQTILRGEMNAGKLADIREQIASVSQGDRKIGDQLLFASLSSVQNDGQATSVLRSMQDLGMDVEHPEQFNKLSGLMLDRTNKVKSYDAGLAVQNYQLELAQDRSQYRGGVLPPEKVAQYAQRWYGIDSVHGVGMEGSGLVAMMDRGIAKEVRQNAWSLAMTGKLGTNTLSRVAASLGESPGAVMSKDYDSAVSSFAVSSSPALRATLDGTGIIDPMKSDAAARDYASIVMSTAHRAASDNTISDTFKSLMGSPLTGKDPAKMARSFAWYNRLYADGGLTKDELHRYFPDSTAENHFWGMQGMSQGGREMLQIAKDLTDYPYDQKVLDAGMADGRLNLAKLSGLPSKPEDIDAKISKARNAAFLDSGNRRQWYKFDAAVGTDSNESAVFDALLADQFMIQKRGGKQVDIDAAVKAVAGQTGSFLLTPTANGGLQAYRDPYQGRGRTMLQPLNADASSPISVAKGFRPVYALGAQIANAAGELEDTLVTWAEDAQNASKSFPGRIRPDTKLYLERQGKDGLSMVKDETGSMIQFMPGHKVVMPVSKTVERPATEDYEMEIPGTLPVQFMTVKGRAAGTVTTVTNESVEIPKDPKAATAFFRKNLGAGWEALPIGFNGPDGHGWVLHYAPRVKVGEAERDQQIAERRTATMNERARRSDIRERNESLGSPESAVQLQPAPTAFARP